MALEWRPHGGGEPVADWRAIDDGGFLVATVVRYRDTVDGDGPRFGAPYWVARVRQERVKGRHASAEEAMAAADRAHDSDPAV